MATITECPRCIQHRKQGTTTCSVCGTATLVYQTGYAGDSEDDEMDSLDAEEFLAASDDHPWDDCREPKE